MIKNELYLIIFWEKADIDMDFARRSIKQEGFDCELVKGHLSSVEQLKFIKQLYYRSITNFDQKLERVGASKIIVGIVHDSAPDYQLIHTTRGFSNVNKNILELKKKLRSYEKVNDGVHLSDTMEEANHNLFLSFSKTYFELEQTWRNIEFCPKKVENISDILICKIVKVKDVKFAPYLLNEYFQLELYGNKYAPKVFSYFFDDGKYHIIMERINGHRLDHLLSTNRDFIKINKNIILNNLSAAESLLKNKGIMHRDIRETNIFIIPQVKVKLIDFGLSCSVFDKQAPIPSTLANSGDDATDFLRLKDFVARII